MENKTEVVVAENANNQTQPERKSLIENQTVVLKDQNNSKDDFEEKVVTIRRVTKVTKGGRHFRFAAVVVVGDKKVKLV